MLCHTFFLVSDLVPLTICTSAFSLIVQNIQCVSLCADDVPSIAPIQPYRGALRASLQQRAPTAVRDYAVPQVVPVPLHLNNGSRASNWDETEVDTSSEHSSGDEDTHHRNALGALVEAAATVKYKSGAPEPPEPPMLLEPTNTLTVLADTVATESAPPALESESVPPSEEPLAALDAIGLLTAMVMEPDSVEVVDPNVDFTPRELQVLAAELRRSADPELLSRQQLRKVKVQETVKAAELLQTDGELPACRECGAIPYLSYIRCSCRCSSLSIHPPRLQL